MEEPFAMLSGKTKKQTNNKKHKTTSMGVEFLPFLLLVLAFCFGCLVFVCFLFLFGFLGVWFLGLSVLFSCFVSFLVFCSSFLVRLLHGFRFCFKIYFFELRLVERRPQLLNRVANASCSYR